MKIQYILLQYVYILAVIRIILSILIRKVAFGDLLWKKYLMDRLCIYESGVIKAVEGKKSVIIEANSGGEVIGLNNLLVHIKRRHPNLAIVVTVGNFDAYSVAEKLKFKDAVVYHPFDIDFFIKRMLCKLRPTCILFTLFPLYPELAKVAGESKVVIGLINGHLRRKHMNKPDVKKIFKRFAVAKGFEYFDFCIVKAEEDCDNALSLGAKSSCVYTLGSLKRALPMGSPNKRKSSERKPRRRFKIILALSVRDGEYETITDAFYRIRNVLPSCFLILAPRYLSDTEKIVALLKKRELDFSLKTQKQSKGEVLVIDTFGELDKFFSIADYVIIGNSFISPGGGQNIWEPLSHAKPIFFGPNMQNHQEFVVDLCKRFPLFRCSTPDELANNILTYSSNGPLESEFKEYINKELVRGSGILQSYLKVIFRFIDSKNTTRIPVKLSFPAIKSKNSF